MVADTWPRQLGGQESETNKYMGILDTVEYLNKHPLRENKGRHGDPAEEETAKKQMEKTIKQKQYDISED